MMLTDVTVIPADLTQETSLNGKYVKGITSAVTNPDADIGNATHTHASLGDHTHPGTVASHSHSGTHGGGGSSVPTVPGAGVGTSFANHTHSMSCSSESEAEASNDGAHTHDAFTNDLENRTIAFYKKTNTVIHMSVKSLPRNMTFFYSQTGTLPDGLLANLTYNGKHFKGNATPGTNSGSNLHQHDSQIHTHSVDIGAHEHTFSFGGAAPAGHGSPFVVPLVNQGHSHGSGTAGTTGMVSSGVTSGDSVGHQHDDITHEPAFKTLRLLQVDSVKMSNVGVPKNCIFLWLDLVSLIVSGWQVSDGTNNTINMLDMYPKGDTTPNTTGGSDTHTHSEDTVSHSHTGGSPSHTHSPSGSSATETAVNKTVNSAGTTVSGTHAHSVSTVGAGAAQAVTVTDAASNHTHGAENSEPEAKTVAFVERIN